MRDYRFFDSLSSAIYAAGAHIPLLPKKEAAMKAAVFHRPYEPVPIQDVSVDEPAEREVLVRTVASGVCHSDLHLVDGQAGRYQPPLILGHEGAGIVQAVGKDVTTLRAGDHVVGCLSGFCGACEQCLSGHPNLCVGGFVSRPASAPP